MKKWIVVLILFILITYFYINTINNLHVATISIKINNKFAIDILNDAHILDNVYNSRYIAYSLVYASAILLIALWYSKGE